jgi:hypothetical protein
MLDDCKTDISLAADRLDKISSAIVESASNNTGMQANAQICQLIVEDIMACLVRNNMLNGVRVYSARGMISTIVAGKLQAARILNYKRREEKDK